MSELIEGKIAQILSENFVVINVGSESGVKVGMMFVVLAAGEEVKDPETGEVLGKWEVPKGTIRVTHVQSRLATCEGFRPAEPGEEEVGTHVLSAALIAHSLRPETWRHRDATRLDINRSQVQGMPRIGPISVGDPVREVSLASIIVPEEAESGKTSESPEGAPGAPRDTGKKEAEKEGDESA